MNFFLKFFRRLFQKEWRPYGWVPDFAFKPERKIYDLMQITNPHQLKRGMIIIYHHWNSFEQKSIPKKMVVLSEPHNNDRLPEISEFSGMFLYGDYTWLFSPSLADASVISYETGYNNLSYLVDTGEIMPEWQIKEEFAIIKNN